MKQVVAILLFISLFLLLAWFAVRPAQVANGIGSQVTVVCYISGTDEYNVYRGTLRSTQGGNYKLTVNGANVSFPKRTCSLK